MLELPDNPLVSAKVLVVGDSREAVLPGAWAVIRNTPATLRYRDAMQAHHANPDLNQAYFGGLQGANPAARPGPPTAKPAQLEEDAADPD
jgi:hypothetical protein